MTIGLWVDFRAALRSLRKAPSFTLFAGLCLALGIGAVTSIFTVVDAFVLRPLPFERPRELMNIWSTAGSSELRYFVAAPSFTRLQEMAVGLDVAGAMPVEINLSRQGGDPTSVSAFYATANLSAVMGIKPLAGRWFSAREERQEEKVCLLSEGLWRGQLGGRAEVVGQPILLNGVEYAVLGIVPARLRFPDGADLWLPVTRQVRLGRLGLMAVGRLREGSSIGQAREEVHAIAQRLRELDPILNRSNSLELGDLGWTLQDQLYPTLFAMLAGVGFLLLIACANVGALLATRLRTRLSGIALQAALGASRPRLLRRLLLENGLLAAAAAAVGIGLSRMAVPALMALSPARLPSYQEIGLDQRVLLFAIGVTALTLLLFAAVPVLAVCSRDAARLLATHGRSAAGRIRRPQKLLVVADVALALLLVSGAGLMARNMAALQKTSVGFATDNLTTITVVGSDAWTSTRGGRVAFFKEVTQSIAALPGIQSVGATHSLPIGDVQYWLSFVLEDRPPPAPDAPELGIFQIVTPGFFETLRLPLLEGRIILPSDQEGRLNVIVVSRALADRYWPGGNPIGKLLRPARSKPGDPWWTIVGVVGDARDRGLGQAVGPSLYFPHAQFDRAYASRMRLLIRWGDAAGPSEASIRQAIRSVDPNTILLEPSSMEEILGGSITRERFAGVLSSIFAALALLLAGAGIFGVVSYGVSCRRPELGLRLALGASGNRLKRLTIADALVPVVGGLLLGLASTLACGELLAPQLSSVNPRDPWTLAASMLVLAAAALLAAYIPARKSASLDPALILKGD